MQSIDPALPPLFTTNVVDALFIGDSMTAGNFITAIMASASASSGVVTVSATGHGMVSGMRVNTASMVPAEFNVSEAEITKIDANSFSYLANVADGPAANLSALKPMNYSNLSRQSDLGALFWLNSKSNGAFRCKRNAGANGQTSADMLSRVGTDLQYMTNRGIAIIWVGYNDFAKEARTAAAVYADVVNIAEICRARNHLVVIVSALPWTTGGTTTDHYEAAAYNRSIRNYCGTNNGIRYADAAKYIVDSTAATKFTPLAGMLRTDGIHPTARGAERVAQAIWDVISNDIPTVSRLVSSNADNYGTDSNNTNVFDNGIWTNTGGTVTAPATGVAASSLTVSQSATGAAVASVVARSDGLGYDQQVVFTPTANNDYLMINSSNISVTRIPVGSKFIVMLEMALTGIVGSTMKGVNVYLGVNGDPVSMYILQEGGVSESEYPQSDQTLTVISHEMYMPTTATSFNLLVLVPFGGSGTALTLKIGRISIEKLS